MKTIEELMSIKIIPEILNEVEGCKTEEEIKRVLLSNQSPALRLMLQLVFRPESKLTITELPPYIPDKGPIGLSSSSLFVELPRFYRVFLCRHDLTEKKKKEILIQICESIHPTEAELLGKIIKHDLGIPLLTEKLVRETFPKT